MDFVIGDSIDIVATMLSLGGGPALNPSVAIIHRHASGVATWVYGSGSVVLAATGCYEAVIPLDVSGDNFFRVEGRGLTQGAEEFSIYVRPSSVL